MTNVSLGVPVVPVTALEFLGDKLLSGEGPVLHVYDTNTDEALCAKSVLNPANIHGIRLENQLADSKICVFGGKLVRVVQLARDVQQIASLNCSYSFPQWVSDVLWLSADSGEDLLAVAFAHNSVVLWQWSSCVVLQQARCSQSCILYSSRLVGTSWSNLMLFAGTVFNQIVLWPVSGDGLKEDQHEVMHVLSGHQGVIFAIAYDPVHHRICSASDDRSIRLWHVAYAEITKSEVSISTWRHATFDLVLVLYGHKARVWDVRLLRENIISVGEDATCIIWTYKGQIVQKFKGHKGKSIWSVAVHPDETVIATGGGDCSIRLWRHLAVTTGQTELGQILQRQTHEDEEEEQEEEEVVLSDDDYPRSVALLGSLDYIIVMSNNGVLLVGHVPSWKWTTLFHEARYASYSLLAPSSDGRCVLVASMDGYLKAVFIDDKLNVRSCMEQHIYSGKVFSICWLTSSGESLRFVSSGPNGAMTLWCLEEQKGAVVQRLFSLPAARQRWMTSAVLVDAECSLVCGDRIGSVHVYSMSENGVSSGPIQSYLRIHGTAGVTYVCCHGDHVYTCGRDGHYRKYSMHDGKLHILHAVKVSKGFDWLTRLLFREDDQLLVLGFHTGQFIVEDASSGQILVSLPCGGGHRPWDALITKKSARLVYLTKKNIATVTFDVNIGKQKILKPLLHGREITCVKHLMSLNTPQGSWFVIVTGSEDTSVNVVVIGSRECDSHYCVLASLRGHMSSVRSLCTLPLDGANSWIMLSAGGRAQINVCRLKIWQESSTSGGGCTGEHQPPCCHGNNDISQWRCSYDQVTSHILHPCNDHRTAIPDIETRYMSMTALCLSQPLLGGADVNLIAVACSDGCIRLFILSEVEGRLHLLAQSEYSRHCVLIVQHVICQSTNQRQAYIITSAATDGYISFWDITKFVEQLPNPCHHFSDITKEMHNSNCTSYKTDMATHTQCVVEDIGSTAEMNTCQESCGDEGKVDIQSTKCYDKHNSKTKVSSSKETLSDKTANNVSMHSSSIEKASCRNSQEIAKTMQMAAPLCMIKAHQSGINGMDMSHISENEFLVATGGDDNALSIFLMRYYSDGTDVNLSVVSSVTIPLAHAAQITGVKIVATNNRIVSSSIDQRIIVWRLYHKPALKLEKITTRFCHVADAADLELWENGDVIEGVVCGVGLQTLSVDNVPR